MTKYVDAIMLAVHAKLRPKLDGKENQEHGKQLSAAVVNRLFARVASPMHASLPTLVIDRVAADFLQNEDDSDLLNGIVMSLRTMMTIETDARNMEAMSRTADAMVWIKTIIPLPSEAPDPEMMERLADEALSSILRPRAVELVREAEHLLEILEAAPERGNAFA